MVLCGVLGVASAPPAAGAPPIGLHPIDGAHWQAGSGLPDARGHARNALVRVIDGSDDHPEVAAITGLRGTSTADLGSLGFTVAGDEAGIIPCIKVAYADAHGVRRETMITSRAMRAEAATEPGWTRYSFDGALPAGTIETIELGAHDEIRVDAPDGNGPPRLRPSMRFDDVVVEDRLFTQPGDDDGRTTPGV